MKAITLHQPYASLIAAGAKTIETRSWPPPQSMRGEPIAIHAGKVTADPHCGLFSRECERILGPGWRTDLPAGAVVAIARLADWHRTCERNTSPGPLDDLSPENLLFGGWKCGQYAWMLTDIVRLAAPLPMRGHQGIWTLPEPLPALLT